MLDLELLRAFVAVADCGGFHRAAERLKLTQSTISQQIKRLELETKRPLFRRTTRSVTLTDRARCVTAAHRVRRQHVREGLARCAEALCELETAETRKLRRHAGEGA